MRGSLKRTGAGKDMVRMGVQAWKIMVCAHREKNDEQNPQNPSNTTCEIGVTAA